MISLLTPAVPAPILDTICTAIPGMSAEDMEWHAPYAAIEALWLPKEHDVGDNGDDTDGAGVGDAADPYAERHAQLDTQFRALPRPGTPAYWHALEGAAEQPTPLEVLARCWRERRQALAPYDADRILNLIFGRVQGTLHRWARRSLGATGIASNLVDDLENACYEGIWKELNRDDEPFLLRYFNGALEHIQQHALHSLVHLEGLASTGAKHPKRALRAIQDSLSAPATGDDENYTLADSIADTGAQEQFDLDVLCSDLRDILPSLSQEDRALLSYDIEGKLTQDEIGQRLGITGRTVRNKIKKLHAYLRAAYYGPTNEASRSDQEEADHGQH